MEKENYELIVLKEGLPTISEKVESILDNYTRTKEEFEKAEKEFRDALFKAMQENNIISAKVGKYNISQVIGKPTENLKEDEFTTEVDLPTLQLFVKVETIENFDMEKFIREQPEMYMKYLTKEERLSFDIEKIKKLRPDLAEKYIEEIPSSKKPYLMIKESKSKK